MTRVKLPRICLESIFSMSYGFPGSSNTAVLYLRFIEENRSTCQTRDDNDDDDDADVEHWRNDSVTAPSDREAFALSFIVPHFRELVYRFKAVGRFEGNQCGKDTQCESLFKTEPDKYGNMDNSDIYWVKTKGFLAQTPVSNSFPVRSSRRHKTHRLGSLHAIVVQKLRCAESARR